MTTFRGTGEPSTYVISITPFNRDRSFDESGVRSHLRRLRDAGIGVYVGGGGSGEGFAMSEAEHRRLLEIAVEELKGKVPVRAMGTEPRLASQMIDYVRVAGAAGVDAAQIYSLDQGHGHQPSKDEIRTYFTDILDAVDVPSVISTHQSVGYLIPVDLINELVDHYPHVVGINCSTGDMRYLIELVDTVGDRVEIHVGGPFQALSALSLGATGYLSSEGNLAPRLCVSVIDSFAKRDLAHVFDSYACCRTAFECALRPRGHQSHQSGADPTRPGGWLPTPTATRRLGAGRRRVDHARPQARSSDHRRLVSQGRLTRRTRSRIHPTPHKNGGNLMDPNQQRREAELSRRRVLQLGAAGALALPTLSGLLVVCGDDGGSGTSEPSPTGGGTAPATTVARDLADQTAILKFGQMRGEYYDPIRSVAVEYVQLNCIFDTLLSLSRTDSTIQPRLATEWSVTGNRLRLKLRSGVTFQDGTPFNAEAVKFSMERVLNDAASNTKARLANVSAIEVVDPTTVDIVMKTAAPGPLLIQLTDRPGMIVSPTAVKAAGDQRGVQQEAGRRRHVQARRRLAPA